ncbi:hypothetical protein ACVMHZ_009644 [Bradyrhizobium liaoningense]
MIDMRLTTEARAAGGRSTNATALNHDIVNFIAARGEVTEPELVANISGETPVLLEHLELLFRLGFLSVLSESAGRLSYRLSKLGEWAHSTSYFAIH